jgi:KUP system potassium uptake protein
MLGFWPRLPIAHTSDEVEGQIYVPGVNWTLLVATVLLVLAFGSSSRLAAAYGIAVSSTMVITTCLAAVVAARRWGWPAAAVALVTVTLLTFDLAFLSANFPKIASGGFVPLVFAAAMVVLMSTWANGRRLLGEYVRRNLVPLDDVRELIHLEMGRRVPGSAVFMTSNPEGAPPALIHNFLHNHVVHERVVLLTVVTQPVARVADDVRLTLETLPEGFFRLEARYGFMETPDVPGLLRQAGIPGLSLEHTTFFLGREIPLADRGGLASWRHQLFAAMARNSVNATTFFNLPPDRVMEIGYQLELR